MKMSTPKSPILDRVLDTFEKFQIRWLEYYSSDNDDFSKRRVFNPVEENAIAVAE